MFRRQPAAWLLLLVVLSGFALRAWNAGFDPYMHRIPITDDAEPKLRQALKMAINGEWAPHRFHQPYFLIYTARVAIDLINKDESSSLPLLWKLAPFYTILFSMGTVLLLHRVALRLFNSRTTALLAAFIFSIVPISVIGSRYFKEDIPLMFFCLLALFLMMRLLQTGSRRYLLAAGFATGVAMAVKYMAAMLLPFLVAVYILDILAESREDRLRRALSYHLPAAIFLAILGFLAFNPYVVWDWPRFMHDMVKQADYARSGHHTGVSIHPGEWWWTFYLQKAILPGISILVTVAAAAGMGLACRRKHLPAILLVAWILVYYISVEASPSKPFPFVARYLHPIYPLLCLFSAAAICRLHAWSRPGTKTRIAVLLVIVITLAIPTAKSVLITASLKNDTRFTAAAWMNEQLEPGSRIVVGNIRFSPRPSGERFEVGHRWRIYATSLTRLRRDATDYLAVNSFKYDQFRMGRNNSPRAGRAHAYYEKLKTHCELVKEFRPRFAFQTIAYHNPTILLYRVRGVED